MKYTKEQYKDIERNLQSIILSKAKYPYMKTRWHFERYNISVEFMRSLLGEKPLSTTTLENVNYESIQELRTAFNS